MGPADDNGERPSAPVAGRRRGTRPTIGELMLLVLGLGVGLAVAVPEFRDGPLDLPEGGMLLAGAVLGGLSLVGVPMLIRERSRSRRGRFGPGRLSWFAHGTAAWLLWPPIVIGRQSAARGQNPPLVDPSAAAICYYYGTPLMAVYMTASLLAGGWLRRRGRVGARRPAPMDWREWFGLVLGMGWAVVGLYVLSMIYRGKFR